MTQVVDGKWAFGSLHEGQGPYFTAGGDEQWRLLFRCSNRYKTLNKLIS